jgi:integrase
MDKMAKIPGLMKRGASFVYRANVPKDLHEVYGSKRQIWRTLKATTESEAKREAHKAALEFLEEFATKRAEIAASVHAATTAPEPGLVMTRRYSIASLVRQHASNVLDREEVRGEELFNFYLNDPREFKRRVYNAVECSRLLDHHYSADDIRGFEGWLDHLYDGDADRVVAFIERKRIQGRIAQISRCQAVKDFREFSQLVDALAPDIANDQRRPLIRALIESEIATLSRLAEQEPPAQSTPTPIAQPVASAAEQLPAPKVEMPLLDSVKKSFLDDKRRAGTSMGACNEIYKAIDDFIEVIGDKPINAYAKADVRDYLGVIQSIPPNSRKKVVYRDLSLREIAQKANAAKDKGPDVATIHKKFDAVAGFFRWLNRHYDHMPNNPFDNMRPQERKNVRDARHPFTTDELNKIFTAPPYTGAQSASRWLTPGSLILKDRGIYWLPLIALYSGMRLGEILQLRKGDVKEEEGISYFDVNDDDGKSVKTSAGHRRIPIHPKLVASGLLKYVRKLPSDDTRLVHDIPLSGRAKDRSGRGSRKMADLLSASGAKTEKNSFHSFRHNFEDACRIAGIDHAVMNALQGHVQGDMSDRYGDGKYALSRLHKEIYKIDYKGFTALS